MLQDQEGIAFFSISRVSLRFTLHAQARTYQEHVHHLCCGVLLGAITQACTTTRPRQTTTLWQSQEQRDPFLNGLAYDQRDCRAGGGGGGGGMPGGGGGMGGMAGVGAL